MSLIDQSIDLKLPSDWRDLSFVLQNEQAFSFKELNTAFLLYFYPRDNTPGCTQQAIDFAKHYDFFQTRNIAIIGVSRDNARSHQRFSHKFELPFPLIADTDAVLSNLFLVLKDKNMYGKKVKGIERSSFFFDQTGSLIHQWRKVKAETHVQEIMDFILQHS